MSHRAKIIRDKEGKIVKAGEPKWTKITEMRALRNAMTSISRVPSVLKKINDFRLLYKRMKGNIPDHLKYSADPIQELIYPIFDEVTREENPMIYVHHVRNVFRDGGEFALYIFSCDTAYRAIRNRLIHPFIYDDDFRAKMKVALEKERELEDYLDPECWYDNMKVVSKKITDDKRQKGLIPKGSISSEEAAFHDDMELEKFKEKVRNKEV